MGRTISLEFKLDVVRRLASGCRVTDLERETGVFRAQIYRWRDALERGGEAALQRGPGRRRGDRRDRGGAEPAPVPSGAALAAEVGAWVAGLERTVARQQLELDFFREALQRVEAARRSKSGPGAPASTPPSGR
ncbi:MAG TPA: helix-turn-helix domain-containing protein [Azospirillum sp.]|nr:helix-turn-helix domain-containing protein [Azospirillum sp.]